jgi:hypothetical protein
MIMAEQPSPLLLDYSQPYSTPLYPSAQGLYMNAPSNLSNTSLYHQNNASPLVPAYQNQDYQVGYNYLPPVSPARSAFDELSLVNNIPLPSDDEDEDDSEVLTGLGLYDEAAEDSEPLKLTEEWTPPPESEHAEGDDDEDDEEEEEEEESGSPAEVEPRTPEQASQSLPSEQTGAGKSFTPATYWWAANQASNQYISEPQIQGQHHTWQGVL